MTPLDNDLEAFKAHLLWTLITKLPAHIDHWDRRSLAYFHMVVYGEDDYKKLVEEGTWPV